MRRIAVIAVAFVVVVAVVLAVMLYAFVQRIESVKEDVMSLASGVPEWLGISEAISEGFGIIYNCIALVLLVLFICVLLFVAEVLSWRR